MKTTMSHWKPVIAVTSLVLVGLLGGCSSSHFHETWESVVNPGGGNGNGGSDGNGGWEAAPSEDEVSERYTFTEVEPNDGVNEAQTVAAGGLVTARIGYASDSDDWFVVQAPGNGMLGITLTNLHKEGVKKGMVGRVEIIDGSDMKAKASIAQAKPGAVKQSGMVPVAAGGFYYVHAVPHRDHSAVYRIDVVVASGY